MLFGIVYSIVLIHATNFRRTNCYRFLWCMCRSLSYVGVCSLKFTRLGHFNLKGSRNLYSSTMRTKLVKFPAISELENYFAGYDVRVELRKWIKIAYSSSAN